MSIILLINVCGSRANQDAEKDLQMAITELHPSNFLYLQGNDWGTKLSSPNAFEFVAKKTDLLYICLSRSFEPYSCDKIANDMKLLFDRSLDDGW
jgi:hypothetical protein